MKSIISQIISKETKLKKEQVESLIEIPPEQTLGDYSFPCFVFAKQLKKAPVDISKELVNKIKKPKEIEKIEAKGPYLNFFVNKKAYAEKILKNIAKKQEKSSKQTIMIEFSQANTHKAFHIGHIRGTSIGESLSRISEYLRNKVIRANYQGDTGMHVAKWLWCYQKYHSKEKINPDEKWFAGIYVDAVKRLAENESLQDEVDETNRKLESKEDIKLLALWKQIRKICLDALEIIYKELNTHFDVYYFESEVEEPAKEIVKELVKNKIAEISEGATIINLEKYNLGIWVLLRKDNTVLYSAKDLALAKRKFREFKLDKSVYIVADEQNLHLKQLFKTLELMKLKDAKKCSHVNYGMIRLPTGKMSSRTGQNILYSEFKSEVLSYAKDEIKKRFPDISEKELEKRALAITISAIKFAMLKQDPNKTIVFTKEDALNFEGFTGPYIQYSYARASSILKKSKAKPALKINSIESKEFELVKKIDEFSQAVSSANNSQNPAILANYSYQLAQTFNEFYHSCQVIGSEQESFRLYLVVSFRKVLKNALFLLGIDAIEEM